MLLVLEGLARGPALSCIILPITSCDEPCDCDHRKADPARAHDFAIRRLFACARVTIAANISHNCCQVWRAGRKVGGVRPCL